MSSAFRVNNSEEFDDISANEVVFSLENRTQSGSQVNSGATSYSITFPRAFSSVPKVFLSTARSDAANANFFSLQSVSTTGFTYEFNGIAYATSIVGHSVLQHTLMWLAIQ